MYNYFFYINFYYIKVLIQFNKHLHEEMPHDKSTKLTIIK